MTNTRTRRGRKPRLRTVTFGRLADQPAQPREYLLDPWLREQDSALVWAAAGVGKTMFSLSLALAVAGGGEVLGWSAPRPRKVLVVDGEMPEDDLRERLVYLAGAVRGLDLSAARDNLVLLARHSQDPEAQFPDLANVDQHLDLVRYIKRIGADLVVLDNLSVLAGVEDENSATGTRPVVKFLAMLKQARIATIVIHHSVKGGHTYRGSTMMETTFEVVLGLLKNKGADVVDTTGSTRFGMVWTKYRRRRGPTIRDTSARLAEGPAGPEWIVEATSDDLLEALAALVRTGSYGSQRDLLPALPEHLWPTAGKRPSLGWLNGKLAMAAAKDVLSVKEREALFEAARADGGGTGGELDGDLGDL